MSAKVPHLPFNILTNLTQMTCWMCNLYRPDNKNYRIEYSLKDRDNEHVWCVYEMKEDLVPEGYLVLKRTNAVVFECVRCSMSAPSDDDIHDE